MANLTGHTIGRYNLKELIGQGGMAIVYQALDTRLDSPVAVKVLRTERLSLETLDRTLKRFANEARSVARLTHPNIVNVMDYGEYDGRPYLVMEYLPGGTLREKLGKPMTWQKTVTLLLPIVQALEYAHRQGIIHRDIKPSNILLTETGQPMLSDFGIARILESDETTSLTSPGMSMGTPEYMSPEQGLGKPADIRSDVYSLGIVFYELITGRKPYQADTPMEMVFKHVSESLPNPALFVKDLPEQVRQVLLIALHKNPEKRYQSMGEFATALEALLVPPNSKQTEARPGVKFRPDTPPKRTLREGRDLQDKTPGKQFYLKGKQIALTLPRPLIWFLILGLCVIFSILLYALITNSSRNDFDYPQTAIMETPIFTVSATPTTFFPTASPILTQIPTPSPLFKARIHSIVGEAALRDTPNGEVIATIKNGTQLIVWPDRPAILSGGIWVHVSSVDTSPEYLEGWALLSLVVTPTPQPAPTLLPEKDGMSMAYIPEGYFIMGNESSVLDEMPAHVVYLPSFWIDKTEITNSMYERCVQVGACKPPYNNSDSTGPIFYGDPKYSSYPVVNVLWMDAMEYCSWVGRRLPTEAEWEKAARGTDGRTYPWGNNDPNPTILNFENNIGHPSEVGSYPLDASPYGVVDMAGNVSEWVNDWYSETYYQSSPSTNPLGPDSGAGRVLRGGAWNVNGDLVLSSDRYSVSPTDTSSYLGFRCARSH